MGRIDSLAEELVRAEKKIEALQADLIAAKIKLEGLDALRMETMKILGKLVEVERIAFRMARAARNVDGVYPTAQAKMISDEMLALRRYDHFRYTKEVTKIS